MDNTKVCNKCHIEKPTSDFYWNEKRPRSFCKSCFNDYNKKYKIALHNRNPNYETQITTKRYRCAKIFCKEMKESNIVKIKCNVCGKEFGVYKHNLYVAHRGGVIYMRKYCSRECQHESMRKSYREKSPYAKKIKELRKTHGV